MSDKIVATDIFKLLEHIEKKSGLFLLKRNLEYLYSFFSGYRFLAVNSPLEIKNLDLLHEDFSVHVKEVLGEEYDSSLGWFGYLHEKYGPHEGFDKFFEHLIEFKKKRCLQL